MKTKAEVFTIFALSVIASRSKASRGSGDTKAADAIYISANAGQRLLDDSVATSYNLSQDVNPWKSKRAREDMITNVSVERSQLKVPSNASISGVKLETKTPPKIFHGSEYLFVAVTVDGVMSADPYDMPVSTTLYDTVLKPTAVSWRRKRGIDQVYATAVCSYEKSDLAFKFWKNRWEPNPVRVDLFLITEATMRDHRGFPVLDGMTPVASYLPCAAPQHTPKDASETSWDFSSWGLPKFLTEGCGTEGCGILVPSEEPDHKRRHHKRRPHGTRRGV